MADAPPYVYKPRPASGSLAETFDRLVAMRLSGNSYPAIARVLGVEPATVYRWVRDYPEIERRLHEEASYALVVAREELPAAVRDAIVRLRSIVSGGASSDRDAVAAAKVLLEVVSAGAGAGGGSDGGASGSGSGSRVVDAKPSAELRDELRKQLGDGGS
jgi:transposase-like protein